jgi:hypothetical protein
MITQDQDYEIASLSIMSYLRNLVKFGTWVGLRGVVQDSREGNLLHHLLEDPNRVHFHSPNQPAKINIGSDQRPPLRFVDQIKETP